MNILQEQLLFHLPLFCPNRLLSVSYFYTMLNKANKTKQSYNEETVAFFDEFAKNYNSILDQKDSNKIIRQRVAQKFCNSVKPGLVLDFGGGTGLDLSWLTENEFEVFFCEPSSGMR